MALSRHLTEGATVIGAGNAWNLKLAGEGSVIFHADAENATISSPELKTGAWAQITIICDAESRAKCWSTEQNNIQVNSPPSLLRRAT